MTRVLLVLLGLILFQPKSTLAWIIPNDSALGGCDTSILYPRTGLALYTLYMPQHERYVAYYRYAHRSTPQGFTSLQSGRAEQKHQLHAEGSVRFPIWGAYGKADYSKTQKQKVSHVLTAFPQLFFPYIVLDTSQRELTTEKYQMAGTLNYQLNGFLVGLGGDFTGITHFGLKDPRPRSRFGDFTTIIALGYRTSLYAISVEAAYRYYSESFSLQNKQEDRQDPIYYHLGMGLYDHRLSIAKKTESLRYIFSEATAVLQLAPLIKYCPLLQFSYHRRNAFGRSLLYTKLAENFEQAWEGLFFLPLAYEQHSLRIGGVVSYTIRLGYEIDYALHIVNPEPQITEQREYQRANNWTAQNSDYKAVFSYEHTTSTLRCGVDYSSSLARLNTNYKKNRYYFSNRAWQQQLTLSIHAFFIKSDLLFNLSGYSFLPLRHSVKWANTVTTFRAFQNTWETFYNAPRFQISLGLEGGYLIHTSQRLALALTASYAHSQKVKEPAWGIDVALRYSFFKK